MEILKLEVECWKSTVDAQKHFNELCLQTRRGGTTLLVAIGAGFGVALEKDLPTAALALWWLAFVSWLAFWYMERGWYHQLLLGSVDHGVEIERRHAERLPSMALGTTIMKRVSYRQARWRGHGFYAIGILAILMARLFLLR